jgi:2',3'-cyclic-nucleotide 2'-phosphodiesterase (5'-nucleotidase family)
MVRSFSYLLLITWFAFVFSCKPVYNSKSIGTQNISVEKDNLVIDSQVVKLYLPYKEILEKDMKRVISYAGEEMIKGKPESGLTNLLSDLLLEEGKKFTQKENPDIQPEISYFNYGGIRTFLPKGDITVGKIFELMPFENEMVFIQLSGVQIQEFFDIVASRGGDSLAGVEFIISGEKAKNVKVGTQNLNPDKYYWLVTNDYSASGGDNLEVFKQRREIVGSGQKIRDIIISNFEVRQEKNLALKNYSDGRISYE